MSAEESVTRIYKPGEWTFPTNTGQLNIVARIAKPSTAIRHENRISTHETADQVMVSIAYFRDRRKIGHTEFREGPELDALEEAIKRARAAQAKRAASNS